MQNLIPQFQAGESRHSEKIKPGYRLPDQVEDRLRRYDEKAPESCHFENLYVGKWNLRMLNIMKPRFFIISFIEMTENDFRRHDEKNEITMTLI